MKKFVFGSISIVTIILFQTGCASLFHDKNQERYESDRKDIVIQYAQYRFAPFCHINDSNFLTLNTPCPAMIYIEMQPNFDGVLKCYKSSKTKKDFAKCSRRKDKLEGDFFAKIATRYKFANWKEINLKCAIKENNCNTFQGFELLALDSHNDYVNNEMKIAIAEFDQAYANRILEDREREQLNQKLDSILASMNQPKATNCNLQKNYIGGFFVQCY